MPTVRASLVNSTPRALPRLYLQPMSRNNAISRRTYASHRPEYPPSKTEGLGGIPWVVGAVAIALPTGFYFISSGHDDDVRHNDHDQQKELQSSHPGIMNTPTKDISTKADGSDSDLPEGAPNRPDNREKSLKCRADADDGHHHQIEKKLALKPTTKKVDPMK